MSVVLRHEWGAAPAAKAEPLTGAIGIAVHWPAMADPLRTVSEVSAALRAWQRFHMSAKGMRDIAYQVAVDQAGNRYELRGLDGQSGANGDTDVNQRYGAVLAVLAPGEQPSQAMIEELRRVVADHRRLFPRSTRVVGHQDIRPEPTACPGPALQRLVDEGALEPQPSQAAKIRAGLNRASRDLKDALSSASKPRRPRLQFQINRAIKAVSKARKINRGD